MRYPTCGDYFYDSNGDLQFRVAKMSNPDYEFLIRIHEQFEQYLTEKHGISEESITNFDIHYEMGRIKGLVSKDAEPGDDPRCAYKNEHRFAENIERLAAHELKVDWQKYTNEVMSL